LKRRGLLLAGLPLPAFAQRASTAQPNVQVLAERLPMPGLNRERTLRLYLPPSYDQQPDRRWPTIYMHDAQNLFDDATSGSGEWGVDETLNALARDAGFEAIVVGIDHGGDLRIQEMLPWPQPPRFPVAEGDAYADFLVKTVKPWIDARWRTRAGADHTAIAGSSLGAVISQHMLLRHAGVFGKAALFSPAYWIAPRLFDAAEHTPLPAGSRVCLYAGGAEGESMLPLARRMHSLLQRQGTATVLHEAPTARHHESAWRVAFEPALRWLFALG
jgi:predicted alpha/beta superfamily hydrolase